MLVVIALIGILAAIAVPGLKNFQRGDTMVAGTRQMQDEIGRARQLAISQRTTVYMIFCPTNFWNDPAFTSLPSSERNKGTNLYDKQLEAYAFVTLRSVGDQPGQLSPRYLTPWRTLPEGTFIPMYKFNPRNITTPIFDPPQDLTLPADYNIRGFAVTNTIPFPSAEAYDPNDPNRRFVYLPYIAFNHLGQLVSGQDEFIPLAQGRINQARTAEGIPVAGQPRIIESPVGNTTNSFMIVHIDWLTGRARLERQEVQ